MCLTHPSHPSHVSYTSYMSYSGETEVQPYDNSTHGR